MIRFCRSLGCDGPVGLQAAAGLGPDRHGAGHAHPGHRRGLDARAGRQGAGQHRVGHPAGARAAQPRRDRPRDRPADGGRARRVLRRRPLRRRWPTTRSSSSCASACRRAPITDPRLQVLAANVLRPGRRGRHHQQQRPGRGPAGGGRRGARERGAPVVAITASQSPLAQQGRRRARSSTTSRTSTTHVPMISRILHLLVIDILAVGVAMRRGADSVAAAAARATIAGFDEAPSAARQPGARRAGPGISAAGPLAHLTAHSR
ncbi:MAG: hypothetical protein MZW92_66405 [Comamonadaceae bacterium]|nr:hypothetical protein [Comamonadaceae bacterium]